ncbi:GntR family transcriptional regulator [Sulfurisphaera ohwakuensis]|uniref:DNA-binding GntR family transcriptional regulator n=1 Tax=Sulfurisphaera ohwakuensis TaxID=69656 RepID=A0A650CKA9_SULOH|nr:GntR family transcriptional regulator [Sulfurisphaera ohwakuensis]MBB5255122.1 DNA-binding GntR family transcriptional regulator [Sulfurisphaera ohwakuensis]QGR18153.1 FCD domain-containing protein [Sulfurisphaera ohwakuensis]
MSLSQLAYEKILNLIINGKYKPGNLLKEDELANTLNISRTPVREALARLERDGIIIKSGKSYSVIPLSAEDIIQIYEIRIPLEAEASKLASIRGTEEELKKMLDIIEEIKRVKEDAEPLTLAELNGKLHRTISEASHNKFLVDILENIRLKLKIVRVTLFTSFQRREEELREHSEIVTSIIERNPDKAYQLMKEHELNVLEYVKKNILPILFR